MDIKEVKIKAEVKEHLKKITPLLGGALRAVIGFLLSRAVIFTSYAPFGIAYAAASSPMGIIGAILGYLFQLHKINGLKYCAICVMAYTASYVFRGTRLLRKRWFMPFAVTLSTAVIGIIFVAEAGFKGTDVILYTTELLLCALFSYFYQFCYRGASDALQKVALALLVLTLIVPLSNIQVFGLSIGRTLAQTGIMLAGFLGGSGYGSATGIALSFAVGESYYSAIYGICGLLAPIFRKKGEHIYSASYLAIAIGAMLWTTMQFKANVVFETIFGAILFAPVAHFYGDWLKGSILFKPATESATTKYIRNIAKERLFKVSAAYESIAKIFKGAKYQNKGNIASVFNAPVERICKKCVLSSSCWEREYVTTRDALNKVCDIMQERGAIEASDFPHHFNARCIKIEQLTQEINYELKKFLYREKCNKKIGESREMLARQYDEVSDVMCEIATELDLSFDEVAQMKTDELLSDEGICAQSYIYRDSANHLYIEIFGDNISSINAEALASRLSDEIGVILSTPEYTNTDEFEKITLREKEVFEVKFGAAISKKNGTDISGDAGSYFKVGNGTVAIILADGMGSGADAAKVSTTAIKLLERFVRAGITPSLAIKTMSSAMLLSGEQSGGFTTIDFMKFDLYSGNSELYKLGSAPTYIKRGENVRRISSLSMPAGIPNIEKQGVERFTQNIHDGDFVVFITDGIAESDDVWLYELISKYDEESAKGLANEIIATATAKNGAVDDMTVLVMRVDKNDQRRER